MNCHKHESNYSPYLYKVIFDNPRQLHCKTASEKLAHTTARYCERPPLRKEVSTPPPQQTFTQSRFVPLSHFAEHLTVTNFAPLLLQSLPFFLQPGLVSFRNQVPRVHVAVHAHRYTLLKRKVGKTISLVSSFQIYMRKVIVFEHGNSYKIRIRGDVQIKRVLS